MNRAGVATVLVTATLLLSALWMTSGRHAAASAPASTGTVIAVNSASMEDLCLLPGVGPRLAQRLVEDRRDGGSFRNVDDLRRVKGLGPRTLERIRPFIRLDTGGL